MDKLPDYQELEDAYQGVSDVIKKLPDNDWTGRAIDNLKISERAAHQSRERAGIDERSAEPVTADASVALRLGQETAFTAVQVARAFEEEYIAAVTIAKEEPCED